MGQFLQAFLARLTTSAIYQLAAVFAGAYATSPLLGIDFWALTAVSSIPVFVWHGWGKQHAESRREQEARKRQLIDAAYCAVEMAYDTRILNPTAQGNPYAILKNARDATDAVASRIENPPEPLGMESDGDLLEKWFIALRNARHNGN